MESSIDDLLEDVDDEASARNAEVFIAVLNQLDSSRDDIRRKILSSFPPTCKAMRARRRLNKLSNYLENLKNERVNEFDASGYDAYHDPWPGLSKRLRYARERIEHYIERLDHQLPCGECHSCKSNMGDINYTRPRARWGQPKPKGDEPFQKFLKTELPLVVSEITKSLKEDLFSLI